MNFKFNLNTFEVTDTCNVIENKNTIFLFDGWINEKKLKDCVLEDINSLKHYSGEFFAVSINKVDKSVQIINDKKCSFLIFYNTNSKIISTNLSDFDEDIDQEWCQDAFQRGRTEIYSDRVRDIKSYKKRYLTNKNNYLLRNTFYVPPRCELLYEKDFVLKEYVSIDEMFNTININSKKDLVTYVKERLSNNIKRIYESYDQKKLLFGSTGIDSMTLVSILLDEKKHFEFINYHFKDVKLSSEKRRKAEQLEQFIRTRSILTHSHTYSIKEFLCSFEKYNHLVNHYLGNSDILYDVFASVSFDDHVRLKGTWGDECFWHEEHAMMFYYKQKGYSYIESKKLCMKEYCSLSSEDMIKINEDEYNSAGADWKENCKLYYLFKYPNYITSERKFSNKMAFSPYADDLLLNLPYRIKNEALSVACMTGEIQKSIIGKDLLRYLNANKDGEQSIKNLKWMVPNQTFFKNLLKNKFTYMQIKNSKQILMDEKIINFDTFDRYCLLALIKKLS